MGSFSFFRLKKRNLNDIYYSNINNPHLGYKMRNIRKLTPALLQRIIKEEKQKIMLENKKTNKVKKTSKKKKELLKIIKEQKVLLKKLRLLQKRKKQLKNL